MGYKSIGMLVSRPATSGCAQAKQLVFTAAEQVHGLQRRMQQGNFYQHSSGTESGSRRADAN